MYKLNNNKKKKKKNNINININKMSLFQFQCIKGRALIGDTFHIELEFRNIVFLGEGKTVEYPEENLPEQGQGPTTNSFHI